MKDFGTGNIFDDYFDNLDVRQEARRFEERREKGEYYYMDLTTIDEVLEYYRIIEDWEKAHALIDHALGQFPYNAELFYKRSCLALELERLEEARYDVEVALKLRPDEVAFLVQKARVLTMQSSFIDARETLSCALQYVDNPGEIYFELGLIAQNAEDYIEALRYFMAALKCNAGFEEALAESVICLEMLEETESAVRLVDEYLDEYPFSAQAWFLLGSTHYRLGFFEKAIRAFDYAILLNDDFVPAYHGKGNAQIEIYKYDAAVRTFLELLVRFPYDEAGLLSVADCFYAIEDYNTARRYYRRCNKFFPDSPDALAGIGDSLKAQRRYLEAIRFYMRAVERADGEHVEALAGLAEAEYQLGNPVYAQTALARALQLAPDDVKLWQEWAARFEKDGELEVALDLLTDAIEINPLAAELLYQYSVYAFRAGRSNEALVFLENALLSDYSKHRIILRLSPEIWNLTPIRQLIEQYRPR